MKRKSKYQKHLQLLEKLEDTIKNSRNKSSQTHLAMIKKIKAEFSKQSPNVEVIKSGWKTVKKVAVVGGAIDGVEEVVEDISILIVAL